MGEAIWSKTLHITHAIVMWIMTGVPPLCGKPCRIKHAINAHKFCCPFVVAGLMLSFRNREMNAYVYLIMHGGYGITWLFKDVTFPDRSWETPASVPSVVLLFCCMS